MTMRIALVPYKPGQEPEGMVSSLDPECYEDDGQIRLIKHHSPHLTVIAAAVKAVKAAKRDPWAEWRESLRPGVWRARTSCHADGPWEVMDGLGGSAVCNKASAILCAAAPDMAEALREILQGSYGEDNWTADIAANALRKAGAPVDEPESAEDVPSAEERNRRQRAGLCRLCGGLKGRLRFWCPACDSATNAAVRDDLDNNREEMCRIDEELAAEDVPELWVSRDDELRADVWRGKPKWSEVFRYFCWDEDIGDDLPRLPTALADALALKPGDCRRVTKAEYERYFRAVLDLPPSERYAALERMVP